MLASAEVWVSIIHSVLLEKINLTKLSGDKEESSEQISSIDQTVGCSASNGIDTEDLIITQARSHGLKSVVDKEENHCYARVEQVPRVLDDALLRRGKDTSTCVVILQLTVIVLGNFVVVIHLERLTLALRDDDTLNAVHGDLGIGSVGLWWQIILVVLGAIVRSAILLVLLSLLFAV